MRVDKALTYSISKLYRAVYQQYVIDQEDLTTGANPSREFMNIIGNPRWPNTQAHKTIVSWNSQLLDDLNAVNSRLERMFRREYQTTVLRHLHSYILDWPRLYATLLERATSRQISTSLKTALKWTDPKLSRFPPQVIQQVDTIVRMADTTTVRQLLELDPVLPTYSDDQRFTVVKSPPLQMETDFPDIPDNDQIPKLTTDKSSEPLFTDRERFSNSILSNDDFDFNDNSITEIPNTPPGPHATKKQQHSVISLFPKFDSDEYDSEPDHDSATNIHTQVREPHPTTTPPTYPAPTTATKSTNVDMSNSTNATTTHSSSGFDTTNFDASNHDSMKVHVSFASPIETTAKSGKELQPVNNTSTPMKKQHLPTTSTSTDPPPIITVRGGKDPLSNMYLSNIKVKGRNFKSVEHWYQAEKASYLGFPLLARDILLTDSAYAAKRLANREFYSPFFKRSSTENPDLANKLKVWLNTVRFNKMNEILHIKFDQVADFRTNLKQTGAAYIAHNVQDTIWGIGSDNIQDFKLNSKNIFGRCLMELRSLKFDVPIPDIPDLPCTTEPKTNPIDTGPHPSSRKRPLNFELPAPKRPVSSTHKDDNNLSHLTQKDTLSSASNLKPNHKHSTSNVNIENSQPPISKKIPIQIDIHNRAHNEKKDDWTPPLAEFEILVIGDSNTKRMTSIPKQWENRLAIHSYPGAHIRHATIMLRKSQVFPHTQHVILAMGINDRDANFHSTIKKYISALCSIIPKKFPNAKLHFPLLPQNLDVLQHQQITAMYKFLTSKQVNLLKYPSNLTFLDNIHLDEGSAIATIEYWLQQLSP